MMQVATNPCLNAVAAAYWPWMAGRALACLPFDLTRAAHARAVQTGLLPLSMLESRDFEAWLVALEGATLGALARRA